jgi:hypothetical protein
VGVQPQPIVIWWSDDRVHWNAAPQNVANVSLDQGKSGAVNGVNAAFRLPWTAPYGFALYRGRWRQYPTADYTVINYTVTLAYPLQPGESLWADMSLYSYASQLEIGDNLLTPVYNEALAGTVGGGNTSFTTANIPATSPHITQGRWGLRFGLDFSWTASTEMIGFTFPPASQPYADYVHD